MSPSTIPHTHTPTLHKTHALIYIQSHPQHHLLITIVTMPLKQAVVAYEAFREITNFIRDNGNDWGEFCHNTSRPSTTRKTVKTPPPSNRKVSHHKNAENKGTLAPKPLLQANPHCFVLFPIQHNDNGGCIRKPKPPFGLLKKSTSRAML